MGKRISFLMILVVLCAALVALVGCGGSDDVWKSDETHHWHSDADKAEHTFGDWTEITAPDCTTEGEQERTCSVCGYVGKESIAATGHTFDTTWKSNDTHHWNVATCHVTEKGNEAPHTFVNGVCTVCKKDQPATAGIIYEAHPTIRMKAVVVGVEAGVTLKGSVVIASTSTFGDVVGIADGAFDGCNQITSILITDKVTSVGAYAFRNCASLSQINGMNKVTSIGDHAFDGCASLTSVTIPGGVTTIGAYAYNGCTALTSVTFGTKLKTLGIRAFADCTALNSITLPTGLNRVGKSVLAGSGYANNAANYTDGVLYNGTYLLAADTALTTVTVKADTTLIADGAFANCRDLVLVNGITDAMKLGAGAFDGCDKMTDAGTIVVEGDYQFLNNGGYFLIGYTGTAKAITLPAGVNGADYAIYQYAFCGTDITSVTIPAGVTAIGAHAFDGCAALTTVAMNGAVASIGEQAFNGCSALANLTIGSSVASIGNSAFAGCTALTALTLPESVETIGEQAFNGCTGLVKVTFGTKVTGVGEGAFLNCRNIDEIYITDIAAWCGIAFADRDAHPFNEYFENDTNKFYVNNVEVTTLTIPAGVTGIGNWVFYNCDRITKLVLTNEVNFIGRGAFRTYTNGGLTELECSTTGWQAFTTLTSPSGSDITLNAEYVKNNYKYFLKIAE